MTHLSVVINTKNAARTLKQCLSSISKIADEIIVADMHSSDDTVKIAEKFHAKVFRISDYGFVEPGRNIAIKKATGTWILLLDADEEIPKGTGKHLLKLIKNANEAAFSFPRKNYQFGVWRKNGNRWPDYQIRLFRKNAVSWKDQIHSVPVVNGTIKTLPSTGNVFLIHRHYVNVSNALEKIQQEAQHEHYYDQQKNLKLDHVLHRMTTEFNSRFFEHKGLNDNVHGFIDAKLMEYYRFLEFLHFWEKAGYPMLSTKSIVGMKPQIPAKTFEKIINTIFNHIRSRWQQKTSFSLSDLETIEGWLENKEAIALYTYACRVPTNGVIIEIGSWKGKSTYCLAQGLQDGTLYAIDPFDATGDPESKKEYRALRGTTPLLDQFKENMGRYHLLEKVRICVGTSRMYASKVPKADLIFIDGDHSVAGCRYDVDTYSKLLKVGGYIMLHDYFPSRKRHGPTVAIEGFLKRSKRFTFVEQAGSLWIAQRIK